MTRIIRLTAQTGVFLACCAGCLGDSTGPEGTAPVAGTWQFSGRQTVGTAATLAGTLVLQSQSRTTYSGSLDVVATLAGAAAQRLAGPVSGRVVNESTVDFAATLSGIERQHIGTVVADTISGTWLETSGNSVGASGTFRAIRTAR